MSKYKQRQHWPGQPFSYLPCHCTSPYSPDTSSLWYPNREIKETVFHFCVTICVTAQRDSFQHVWTNDTSHGVTDTMNDLECSKECFCMPSNLQRRKRFCKCFCSGVRVPTTGEELWPDGGNDLALERLGVGALGVLDNEVPLFDPTQQPQKVAVAEQVGGLKLPVDIKKHTGTGEMVRLCQISSQVTKSLTCLMEKHQFFCRILCLEHHLLESFDHHHVTAQQHAPYHTYNDFRDTKLSKVPWANEENMFPERFLGKKMMENHLFRSATKTWLYKCLLWRTIDTFIKILMTYSLIRLVRPVKMSTLRQPMLLLDKSL